MRKMLAAAFLVLAGCATVSDVVPTGGDAYMLSAHGIAGHGSAAEQKAIGIRRANEYCNAKQLQMQLGETRLTDPKFATAPAAEIDFRCIKPE